MRKIFIFISVALSAVGCDQSNQQVTAQPKVEIQKVVSKKPAFESYGEQGIINTWPPITNQDVPIAENVVSSNYYIVVDGSGSMAERKCSDHRNKMEIAKQAIRQFIDKLPDNAHLGMFAFDAQSSGERLPLGKHSKSKAIDIVDSLRSGGGTPLSVSIRSGVDALTSQGVRQLGYGEYHLVVVTDGQASTGYSPDKAVNQLLEGTPIVLHTIGFCIGDNHSLNRPGYTIYKGANNPKALMAGLDAVLAESPTFDVTTFEGKE